MIKPEYLLIEYVERTVILSLKMIEIITILHNIEISVRCI